MLQRNSTLLVLAAPEWSPPVRDGEHPVLTLASSPELDLIGWGQCSSALRRAKESKPGGRTANSPEHSAKAFPVYLCHLDPAVTRVLRSGLSSTGLARNLLPTSPPTAP